MKTNVMIIGFACRTPTPLTNHAAPMIPPIKACEVEIGIPNFVQAATQIAAPISAERIKYGLITCWSAKLAIVLPTANC